jgi:hypothetical protein
MNPALQRQPHDLTHTSENEPAAQTSRQMNTGPADPNDFLVELKYRDPANLATGKFATGLGIFSLVLGLAEVLAPKRLGEMIGVNDQHRALLPALGLREIASGIAILTSTKPTAAVWSRVGGDAMDLAYLGSAFMSDDTNKARLIAATAAVLGATAMDVVCAQQLSSQDWTANTGNPAAPTNVGQPSARHKVNTRVH